jgi:hypothetical protein
MKEVVMVEKVNGGGGEHAVLQTVVVNGSGVISGQSQ